MKLSVNTLDIDSLPHNLPVRVGILGYSDISRRKFIPALLQSRLAMLSGIGSRNSATAMTADFAVDCPVMDYQELITTPDIDFVYICLPNDLHEEWTIRALQMGKHVLCEKPLGLSLQSVNRMLEAAEKYDKLLFENLMYLQHPQHEAVKAIIDAGRMGRVTGMRSEFAFPGPANGNFRLNPSMGGGAFHDLNRYPLSAALFFLKGKTYRFLRGSIDVQDGLNRSLQADAITDEAEAFSFQVAFGQPYRSFYEIKGEKGTIRVERAFTTPADLENRILVSIDNSNCSFHMPPSDHFLGTIDYVCRLIHSGTWSAEHKRARKLAELAEMFHDNCIRRGNEHGNA